MFSVKSFEFLLMTLAGYYRLQKTAKHYGINELMNFIRKKNLERNKDAHNRGSSVLVPVVPKNLSLVAQALMPVGKKVTQKTHYKSAKNENNDLKISDSIA